MPKIVSVHSFRHGAGKSNLTANLAVTIARQRQHVGIIDIDLQAPGIHTLFGLDDNKADHVLNYYLWGSDGQSNNSSSSSSIPSIKVEEGEITVMGGGVYLNPFTARINDIPQLLRQGYDMNKLSQGFVELSSRLNLDCLFIDTAPGLTEETLLSIALSDVLVLLLRLDTQNFQGVAVTVDIARKLGVPQILLVANQVLPTYPEDDVRDQLETTYGEAVAGVLPFTEEMLELASRGIFCLHYPDHPLTEQIEAIAEQILSTEAGDWAARQPSTSSDLQVPEKPPSLGLSMFDVLSLPEAQRQIMNLVMRQGTATLAEIASFTGQEEASLHPLLAALVEKGFVQTITTDGISKYCPYMTTLQKRQIPENIWKLMDKKPNE